ncbi:MAG: glycosyltransferase family 4 protein [Fervidobacterium sp.]
MRILMVSDTYLPQINGVATSIYLSKKYLEMRGHEVFIIAPVAPENDERILVVPGVPFLLEKQHRVVFANHLKMVEFAEKNSIDVIHSHDPLALGIRALKIQRTLKLPHIHTYHTLLTEYRHYVPPPLTPDRKTVEEFSRWFCDKVNIVIAPTEEIKNELIRYKVQRPIEVLPTGIDTQEFSKPPKLDVRQTYNIPRDALVLMYAGRLSKEKNLEFLFRVVGRYIRENLQAWFLVVGDGPERKELENLAEELGISKKTVFTGYVPHKEIKEYYKASDLFVFSSLTETQGLVVLEALASGTPVVAIAYKGIANVLVNGEGAITTGINEDEFYNAVVKAIDEKEVLSKKGIEYVEKYWSMNKMADKLEEIYSKAIDEGYIDFQMPTIINSSLLLRINALFKKLIYRSENR